MGVLNFGLFQLEIVEVDTPLSTLRALEVTTQTPPRRKLLFDEVA